MNDLDFINRIGERTGLTEREDIDAYMNFVHGANYNDGVILLGGVQHDFYRGLVDKADLKTKELERIMNNMRGNNEVPMDTRTPLMLEAKMLTDYYFGLFVDMDLISEPQIVNLSQTKYPVLKGYNYFNDREIYERVGTSGRRLIRN